MPECDAEEKGIIDVRLSPDNKQAAYAGATAIWTCDLERNTKTRVTFDNQPLQQPSWSPDGKTLMFIAPLAQGGGNVDIRTKAADGSGPEKNADSTTITITILRGRPMENTSRICGAMARSRFLSGSCQSLENRSRSPSCSRPSPQANIIFIESLPMGTGSLMPPTKRGNRRFSSQLFRRERANGGYLRMVELIPRGPKVEGNCSTKMPPTISSCAQLPRKDRKS